MRTELVRENIFVVLASQQLKDLLTEYLTPQLVILNKNLFFALLSISTLIWLLIDSNRRMVVQWHHQLI